MQIIENTTAFFTPEEKRIDIYDQLVYVLTKKFKLENFRFLEVINIFRCWLAFMWSIAFCQSMKNSLKKWYVLNPYKQQSFSHWHRSCSKCLSCKTDYLQSPRGCWCCIYKTKTSFLKKWLNTWMTSGAKKIKWNVLPLKHGY